MDYYEQDSCIRGYQIYQNILTAEVDEHFVCESELLNSSDGYVNDIVVGSCHGFRHCFC